MADRSVNINVNYNYNTPATKRQEEATRAAQKATDDLTKSANKAGDASSKAGVNASKSWLSFSNVLKTVSFAIVINELTQVVKNMVNVTAEFQKFEAVLTNTLGSNSKARLALNEITKFAAQTPFSVNELTASYIKLANQGFVPTNKELTKLGDLASSTGKSFDMLTEAIIDAQTGEFERLKEFGIRASKEGDKVTFTFKGVKEQVDFTNESIRNYILSLGEAEGVTGSMAAISETLAGQISNMGDNFEQLLNNLGKYNSGPIGAFFKLFNDGLGKLNEMIATANLTFGDLAEIPLSRFRKAYEEAAAAVKDGKGFDKLNILFQDLTHAINSTNEDIEETTSLIQAMNASGDTEDETYKKLTRDLEVYKAELAGYKEIRKDLVKISDDYNQKLKEQAELDRAAQQASLMDRRKEKFDFKIDTKENAAADFINDFKSKVEDELERGIAVTVPVQPIIPMDAWDKFEMAFQEQWHGLLDQGIEDTANFLKASEEAEVESLQNRLSNIKNFYDEQYLLAGDNERAKKELRLKEERETAALQREIAMREWKAKRNSVIIDTIASIAKTFAQFGYPAGIIPALAAAATGAAQLSALERAKPAFKDGVIDLKGPGTETSDSIDARLSRGESVITARATRRSRELLELIQNNKIDDRILKGIGTGGATVVINEDKIVEAIRNKEYPKAPDLVKQGREIYEVYEVKKNHKKFIRSKSI